MNGFNGGSYKQGFPGGSSNYQNVQNSLHPQGPLPSGVSLYSSMPATQSFIQPNGGSGNSRGQYNSNIPAVSNNDYVVGYPQRGGNPMGFTSAIYNPSKMGMMSPQGHGSGKKVFPGFPSSGGKG
jgi:hypothetical protein